MGGSTKRKILVLNKEVITEKPRSGLFGERAVGCNPSATPIRVLSTQPLSSPLTGA
jgi:hypothetical protein